MPDVAIKPRTKVRLKPERPRLHKVILLNDDYTPREFVVTVLKAEFRMNEDQAYRVMMTAHRRGACVVAVYTRDVAETKATRGTEAGGQGQRLVHAGLFETFKAHASVIPLAGLCLAGERQTGDPSSRSAGLRHFLPLSGKTSANNVLYERNECAATLSG